MCDSEVTVTSLHPPRLCRLVVFSIKPTLLSCTVQTIVSVHLFSHVSLKEQLEPSAHGQGANLERGHFGIEPLTEPCRCVRVHASVRRAARTPPLVPCSHFVTIPARSLLSASMGISNLGNYRPLVSRRGPLRQLASNSECMYVCMHACMHRSLMH